jgi:hypothetical protein
MISVVPDSIVVVPIVRQLRAGSGAATAHFLGNEGADYSEEGSEVKPKAAVGRFGRSGGGPSPGTPDTTVSPRQNNIILTENIHV